MFGPSVGALLTLALTEGLRVWFGTEFIGGANTIYGILLVLCIIFMPQGVVGALQGLKLRRTPQPAKAAVVKP
jgi:branched-chain amino acid transport system permease protein